MKRSGDLLKWATEIEKLTFIRYQGCEYLPEEYSELAYQLRELYHLRLKVHDLEMELSNIHGEMRK